MMALNDILRCKRAFEILWAENHTGSDLLKERETKAKRLRGAWVNVMGP